MNEWMDRSLSSGEGPRVLMVFTSNQVGGAEVSLSKMVAASSGCVSYKLASFAEFGPWHAFCASLGLQAISLSSRNLDRSPVSANRFLRWQQSLQETVESFKADILYVVGLKPLLYAIAIKRQNHGLKLVYGLRWNPNSLTMRDLLFKSLLFFFRNSIDYIIANSQAAAETIDSFPLFFRRSRVIYNGIANDTEAEWSAPIKVATNVTVVTVANISPRKGHEGYIREVVFPLLQVFPDMRFIFVGRDDMQGAMHKLVADLKIERSIEFSGYSDDVRAYLRRGTLFALPSLHSEGCPTAILEAMAQSLPVIAFDIDGVPELIEHEVTGVLVPSKNYAGFRDAISRLCRDAVLTESMGENGRSKVESHFSLSNAAKEHDEFFLQQKVRDAVR
jgi:glycosyltransferase involved in cell wall biosynthesis